MYVIRMGDRILAGTREMLDAVDLALDLSMIERDEISVSRKSLDQDFKIAGFTSGKRVFPRKYSETTLKIWSGNTRAGRAAKKNKKAMVAHAR